MASPPKKKICFVITAEFVVRAFLINHLKELSKIYEVTVVVNTKNPSFLSDIGIKVRVLPLRISREINLLSDLISLIKLVRFFTKHKFNAIHSVTPKAGLLAMLAGKISDTPLRIHTFTGQVWATRHGGKRYVLKKIDAFFAACATHLIIDSPSQLEFLLDENVVTKDKCYVFGKGSISGVDLAKFTPSATEKFKTKRELNIPVDAMVFLFLGRLTEDKGVIDLAKAFNLLAESSAYLLFVGPDEQGIISTLQLILADKSSHVRFISYTNTPEKFMNAADVLVLPSYREGFGTVVIEAAAVGIPTIASRIYGLIDTIIDSETGLLHQSKNVSELHEKMTLLINNNALRLSLGHNARQRVLKNFDSNSLTQKWLEFYSEYLPVGTEV